MINGIINVYKERGFTSHDVVAKLRGILHQKKIGHTGTLDPDAVGVLPVCLGNGTRLCDMLTDTDKVYRARMILGMETDTQDTSGKLLRQCPVRLDGDDWNEEHIRRAMMSFVGDYDQVPPMYSALKVDGKKLYELAREGKAVERKARRVSIRSLDIHEIRSIDRDEFMAGGKDHDGIPGIPGTDVPPDFPKIQVAFTVCCSKGTYIRTLCHDVGAALGVGGCMSALERIRVGIFAKDGAKTLGDIEGLVASGLFEDWVTPVDAMFAKLPAVTVNLLGEKLLRNGNPLGADGILGGFDGAWPEDTHLRVYDQSKKFTAIYAYKKKHRELKVVKMFL